MTPQAPNPSSTVAAPYAKGVLRRTYATPLADEIYTESILRKPLYLRPTQESIPSDARARRQQLRTAHASAANARRKNKPRPLTAKQKRALGLHDIPKEQQRWEVFEPLNRLWRGYILEVLGLDAGSMSAEGRRHGVFLDGKTAGPLLAAADLHGAEVEVVRCRCVGRVGIKGVIAKETKGAFEIVTRGDELKVVPKEYTIFKLEIPIPLGADAMQDDKKSTLVFELHGSQLNRRPAERTTKAFKPHLPPDL